MKLSNSELSKIKMLREHLKKANEIFVSLLDGGLIESNPPTPIKKPTKKEFTAMFHQKITSGERGNKPNYLK